MQSNNNNNKFASHFLLHEEKCTTCVICCCYFFSLFLFLSCAFFARLQLKSKSAFSLILCETLRRAAADGGGREEQESDREEEQREKKQQQTELHWMSSCSHTRTQVHAVWVSEWVSEGERHTPMRLGHSCSWLSRSHACCACAGRAKRQQQQ